MLDSWLNNDTSYNYSSGFFNGAAAAADNKRVNW